MNKVKKMVASGLVALALGTVTLGPAALTGCAAMGVYTPETFNERVVASYKTIEAAAVSVGTLLDSGNLGAADARNAHTTLATMKEAVDVAVQLQSSGDFSSAETRLAATITALEALEVSLRSKQ